MRSNLPNGIFNIDQYVPSDRETPDVLHQWLIAAATPVYRDAPEAMKAKVNAAGRVVRDGTVTPDGYVVNTSFSVNTPRPANIVRQLLIPDLPFTYGLHSFNTSPAPPPSASPPG